MPEGFYVVALDPESLKAMIHEALRQEFENDPHWPTMARMVEVIAAAFMKAHPKVPAETDEVEELKAQISIIRTALHYLVKALQPGDVVTWVSGAFMDPSAQRDLDIAIAGAKDVLDVG